MDIFNKTISLLLTFVYFLPIFLNVGEVYGHINECKEVNSCCIVEEKASCCNTVPVQHSSHTEEKCDDSFFCQYCLQNCDIQQNLNFDFNIGFQTSFNITYKVEPVVQFVKKDFSNIRVDKKSNLQPLDNPEIIHQKIITEFLSLQYFSSNIG
jgi:hypothetical protein